MVITTCYFVLVILNYGLLHGRKRVAKWAFKPYGPKMCTELCEDSSYSFHYIVEDLACNYISETQTTTEMDPFGDLIACMEKNTSNDVTLGHDVHNTEVGDYSPKRQLQTVEPLPTAELEAARYIPNMTLHQACEKGKVGVVKYIILNRLENINRRGKLRRTPIMVAVIHKHAAVFDFLFSQDCDLLAVDNEKNTVFHLACSVGKTEIVKKLFETGKFNHAGSNTNGWTPVLSAAYYGHVETLALLVSKNFSTKEVTYRGNNILHVACAIGHVNTVKYIISHDIIDIDSRGYQRNTPVMLAAVNHQRRVFNLLVCKGSDLKLLDRMNNNILHLACSGGDVLITKYILSLNLFDINCQNSLRQTPVMFVSAGGHKEVFDLLVSEGCKLTIADNQNINTLHAACVGGSIDIVTYLLSHHIFNIDNMGYNGRTAVMFAAERGHREVFDLLVSKGCNLKTVDEDMYNILHVACIGGHVDMVDYILSLKTFQIDVRGFLGRTPAMVAADYGKVGVLRLLLTKGSNLKAMDEQWNNILHVACINNSKKVVKYLITLREVKGMKTERNRYGHTPVQAAKHSGHLEIVSLLKH